MVVIDVHSHWTPACFTEALQAQSQQPGFGEARARLLRSGLRPDPRLNSLDVRIAEMDDAGVDISVLSLPPPGTTMGDRATRRTMAREANDEFLAAGDRYPGRLLALVALPLPDVDDALAELERVASHPAARGVNLQTVTDGWTLDDARFEPVYLRAAELGLPVLAHPAIEVLPEVYDDWMLAASLAPMVSSSLGVARLAHSGLLDRVSGLDVIVPHLGGTLPYLTQRFDDFGQGVAAHPLSHYLRERLYLDTCSFHPPAFRCAIETSGVERIVMGTDYPVRGPLRRAVADITAVVSDETERARVLGGTAAKWFAT